MGPGRHMYTRPRYEKGITKHARLDKSNKQNFLLLLLHLRSYTIPISPAKLLSLMTLLSFCMRLINVAQNSMSRDLGESTGS